MLGTQKKISLFVCILGSTVSQEHFKISLATSFARRSLSLNGRELKVIFHPLVEKIWKCRRQILNSSNLFYFILYVLPNDEIHGGMKMKTFSMKRSVLE